MLRIKLAASVVALGARFAAATGVKAVDLSFALHTSPPFLK